MQYRNFFLPALAGALILLPLSVAAATRVNGAATTLTSDGTITITGNVMDQTCTINGGAPNVRRSLGTARTAALDASGKTSNPTNFDIALTTCPTGSAISAFFMPTSSSINSNGILVNNILPTAGGADNVGVELLTAGRRVQLNRSTISDLALDAVTSGTNRQGIASFTGASHTYTFTAQFHATGVATVGDVEAQVDYTIVYH